MRLPGCCTIFFGAACAVAPVRALAAEVLVSSGVAATASASWDVHVPGRVVDGNHATMWNAGQFAPQWIELDLGIKRDVSMIRLLTAQYPAGATVHQVYGGLTPNPTTLLTTFSGNTVGGSWLSFAPEYPAEDVRYLRVTTTSSPSWVAWLEIEVYAPSIPVHRIGVRQAADGGEFFDRKTGLKFVPRGNNYVRLANVYDPYNGSFVVYHANFDNAWPGCPFPCGQYDHNQADAALAQMRQDGYNHVRVFVSDTGVGKIGGAGLSDGYLNNLADFLVIARARNILVSLTLVFLPRSEGYWPLSEENLELIGRHNQFIMLGPAVEAKKRYTQDLINGLLARGAPTGYVLSYNIENEASFAENEPPLCLCTTQCSPSGCSVATANGATYAMHLPGVAQQAMDANLVYWMNSVRATIKGVDPTALVTAGFNSPLDLAGANSRTIRTYWPIADAAAGGSTADFIELHIAPLPPTGLPTFTLEQYVSSFEISNNTKPLLMGEFNAPRDRYPTATDAGVAMVSWQVASCAHGFDGWVFWTWDTSHPDHDYYYATEAFGAINGALAPVNRPNPCSW